LSLRELKPVLSLRETTSAPSLLELQAAFARGVFDPTDAKIAEAIVPAGMPAADRVAVYRGNVLGNCTSALREAYPVILGLVGERFFDALARRFATQVPSRSGDLHDFGAELGEFLESFAPARDLPYLPDVARLEWAVHCVFHARAAPKLDASELAAVPPERLADLHLELSPAARLVRSAHPILTIWRVNQPEWDGDQAVDLGLGAERVLVIRRALEVMLEPLSQGEYAMLTALEAGAALDDALCTAQSADQDFDLENFLATHMLGGTLTWLRPSG